MTQTQLKGKVQTVLGLIDANDIGMTLFHEHLLASMAAYFQEPTEPAAKKLAHEPRTMENVRQVRLNRNINLDNTILADEQVAIKEALLYKEAGGKTIADVSSNGLSRNPLGLQRIALATGLNIIMGSGYYVGISHPSDMALKTEEQITNEIVHDITVGAGDTGVRSGVIGEIGCTEPLLDGERKVLRAAARAQIKTGASIMIHPPFSDNLALEVIQILADAGADLEHTVICHVNVYGFSLDTCRKIVNAGCYIGYESFGNLAYPHLYLGRLLQHRSDLDYIDAIVRLIEDGYIDHILVSHDICFKDFLRSHGGHGYAHILENAIPVMKIRGISDNQIDTLFVNNPKKYFQFR